MTRGLARLIAERRAELDDEVGEIRLGNERTRPEPGADVFFGDGLGPALDEELQQNEGLRRDR
jgi:hypothetical protein